MYLKSGTTLEGGKYRIIKVLGQGGFGITYLAVNPFLEIRVAIKEFFPKEFCDRLSTSHITLGTSGNRETVERLKKKFLKEARNLAQLNHEGIVRISDVFEENDTAYYVMDHIEGETLTEMVKRRGPLHEKTAVRYTREVGEALEYIHSARMTHFDVKPSNIMINSKTGRALLIDFGLSKQYGEDGMATSSILQGVSQGFSPLELYNTGTLDTFSPKTDLYSLAATLYYLLTGTIPPPASEIAEEGLRIPSNISPAVRNAIIKAMKISRNDRHRSVREFCDSLTYNSYYEPSNSYYEPSPGSGGGMYGGSSRGTSNNVVKPAEQKYSGGGRKKVNIVWVVLLLVLIGIGICIYMNRSEDVSRHHGSYGDQTSALEDSANDSGYNDSLDSVGNVGIVDTFHSNPIEIGEIEEQTNYIHSEPLKENSFFFGIEDEFYEFAEYYMVEGKLLAEGYKSEGSRNNYYGDYVVITDSFSGENVYIEIEHADDNIIRIYLKFKNYDALNEFLSDLLRNGWSCDEMKDFDVNYILYSKELINGYVTGLEVEIDEGP